MKAILLFMLSIGCSSLIVALFDITGPMIVVTYLAVAAFWLLIFGRG